jgi:hypothetical protein
LSGCTSGKNCGRIVEIFSDKLAQNLSSILPQFFPATRARKIFIQFFHNSSTILPRLEQFGASGLAWGRIVEGIIVEEL